MHFIYSGCFRAVVYVRNKCLMHTERSSLISILKGCSSGQEVKKRNDYYSAKNELLMSFRSWRLIALCLRPCQMNHESSDPTADQWWGRRGRKTNDWKAESKRHYDSKKREIEERGSFVSRCTLPVIDQCVSAACLPARISRRSGSTPSAGGCFPSPPEWPGDPGESGRALSATGSNPLGRAGNK